MDSSTYRYKSAPGYKAAKSIPGLLIRVQIRALPLAEVSTNFLLQIPNFENLRIPGIDSTESIPVAWSK